MTIASLSLLGNYRQKQSEELIAQRTKKLQYSKKSSLSSHFEIACTAYAVFSLT